MLEREGEVEQKGQACKIDPDDLVVELGTDEFESFAVGGVGGSEHGQPLLSVDVADVVL